MSTKRIVQFHAQPFRHVVHEVDTPEEADGTVADLAGREVLHRHSVPDTHLGPLCDNGHGCVELGLDVGDVHLAMVDGGRRAGRGSGGRNRPVPTPRLRQLSSGDEDSMTGRALLST